MTSVKNPSWGGTHVIGCKGVRHLIGCRRPPCRKNAFVNQSRARWVSKIRTQMQGGLQIKSTETNACLTIHINVTTSKYVFGEDCKYIVHLWIFNIIYYIYIYIYENAFVYRVRYINIYTHTHTHTTPQIHLWVLFCGFIPWYVHLSIMRLFWLHRHSGTVRLIHHLLYYVVCSINYVRAVVYLLCLFCCVSSCCRHCFYCSFCFHSTKQWKK